MSSVATFMLVGLAFTLFIAVTVFALMPATEAGLLQQRLGSPDVDPLDVEAVELAKPLRDRVILPLVAFVGGIMLRHTKRQQLVAVRRLLRSAGSTMNPESFLFLKTGSLVAGGVAGFLGVLVGHLSGIVAVAAFAAGLLMGYMYPTSKMKGRVKHRGQVLLKSMPGVLDLLTISMEAGLSFDMALARVCDDDDSPLARELQKALNEIRLGRSRQDALMALAERNDVNELSVFVRAVVQAEPLGVPISNVLRIQGEELRRVRRQKAEEKGHRAPVLMLLPMMGCIFPTIFIMLLGPAVIQVVRGGAGLH